MATSGSVSRRVACVVAALAFGAAPVVRRCPDRGRRPGGLPVQGRNPTRRRLLRGAHAPDPRPSRCPSRPSRSAATRCRDAASSPRRALPRFPRTSRPRPGWSPTSTPVTSSPPRDPHGGTAPPASSRFWSRCSPSRTCRSTSRSSAPPTTPPPRAPGSASRTAASTPSTICCTACSCTPATTPPTRWPEQLGGMDAALGKINDPGAQARRPRHPGRHPVGPRRSRA